ncbi:hypothetical protein U9M48_000623 [Paspalum notatum var. saurae]|uniref:Uncharacterized protein n=1 Tax=Paspalum notatum var. saurae TaxID=547442 RepID=A0AAQ3PMR8_PASNO
MPVESLRIPLNTLPKPPPPSFSEKFLVASCKSKYLKAKTPPPSLMFTRTNKTRAGTLTLTTTLMIICLLPLFPQLCTSSAERRRFQSCGDFTENPSMQLHNNGSALSLQTVKGPHTAKTSQGLLGVLMNLTLAKELPDISGTEAKYCPFQFPVEKYTIDELQSLSTICLEPLGSCSMQYEPEAGSTKFFFDTALYFTPVSLLWPIFPPGRITSVGWSKLCQILVAFETSCMTRFPLSKSTAAVLLLVLVLLEIWVDQI